MPCGVVELLEAPVLEKAFGGGGCGGRTCLPPASRLRQGGVGADWVPPVSRLDWLGALDALELVL